MLECVANVSEGCDPALVAAFGAAAGPCLLDVHADASHNRSVFSLAGPARPLRASVQALARAAVGHLDLREHQGVHPRIGVLDVVPFIALRRDRGQIRDGDEQAAVAERDAFAQWAAKELALPCFLYGPQTRRRQAHDIQAHDTQPHGPRPRSTRAAALDPAGPGLGSRDEDSEATTTTLPDLRRRAWHSRLPDYGPTLPHPSAGACAVGARGLLMAYNLWIEGDDSLGVAKRIAAGLRSPTVRALGLQVGRGAQVSCNLIAPARTGPAAVYDAVARQVPVARAELVGLAPDRVLNAVPRHRWTELGLSPETTIEARLEEAGLNGGRFLSSR